MHYTDFVHLATDKGFVHPELLYMVAYHLGDTSEEQIESLLDSCSEEESIWTGIYEYRYHGKVYFVLREPDATRIVDNYRAMLSKKLTEQSDKPSLVTEEDMAASYYHDIFDVFDVIQEVELERDGIVFPKFYIAEC